MSGPVIHCVTNDVTAGRVADAIAAAGGHPILASSELEVAEVAARADAIVLNCGTPSEGRMRALTEAGLAAARVGVPAVLDPVGCGASGWRTAAIRAVADAVRPAIVRGGPAEIAALAGVASGARLLGVSSWGGEEACVAREASNRLGTVVVAGRAVAAGERAAGGAGRAAVLGRVIGAGDVLDALMAIECARRDDPFAAAQRALARFDRAAARAAGGGPGSFWPAFLDALGDAR